jgi:nucleoside-diphosphate-sugar epimerase
MQKDSQKEILDPAAIKGTLNVFKSASNQKFKRIIFPSSVSTLLLSSVSK